LTEHNTNSVHLRRIITGFLLPTLLFAGLTVFSSCSERAVNSQEAIPVEVEIEHAFGSIKTPDVLSSYRLIVIDHETGTVRDTVPLELDGSMLRGSVRVPAYRLLRFIAEAIDDRLAAVVYRGEARTAVRPRQTVNLKIALMPAVPTLKFTPRYIDLSDSTQFEVTVGIFNVDSLFGTSFRINFDGALFQLDSAVIGEFPPEDTIIFFGSLVDPIAAIYAVSLTQTDQAKTLVGAAGSALLSHIYFSLIGRPPTAGEPSILTLDTTGFTYASGSSPAFDLFFTDQLGVNIPPVAVEAP
jgi:hypothetical protein